MEFPDDYPPPDPDGRPHIWLDFAGTPPEVDLGRLGSSMGSIKEQRLELSEGGGVVLCDDDRDEWMLVDEVVDRFNPQGGYGGSWIVRVDWSTFRRRKARRTIRVTDHVVSAQPCYAAHDGA